MVVSSHALGWVIEFAGGQGLQGLGFLLVAVGTEPVGKNMGGFIVGVVSDHLENTQKKLYIVIIGAGK